MDSKPTTKNSVWGFLKSAGVKLRDAVYSLALADIAKSLYSKGKEKI